jgi:ubiquinone/menaquinone biosynthesis C-methylase UbiE
VTDTNYEHYLTLEWEMFTKDQTRAQASLLAVQGRQISRVLDIGCGAGQELLPFAMAGSFCVGMDVSPDVGLIGRKLFLKEKLSQRVAFLRSAAEQIPFASGMFDLVICRLAIPYTDNRLALTEMARILRQGGVLLLKIHHARFYIDKFWRGLMDAEPLNSVHAARVLTAGALYGLLDRQVRNRLVTNETFLSRHMLTRELGRCGLTILREMPDSNPLTPSFVIEKMRA